MKPDKIKVGERIREIRTNLGYSMEEFGRLLGDSPRSSVNNWEKGVSIPKKDKLEKIALLGNRMPEKILYGEADEYLYDLIEQNLGVKLSDSILYEIFETVPPEKRKYDELMWLSVAKYFIENGTYGKIVGEIVYTPMLGMPNLYAGSYKNDFIEQSPTYKQSEIRYYIYADIAKNCLHVMPFNLNEANRKLFFEFPTFIEQAGEHNLYTKNFENIGLTLQDSVLIYYGLDSRNHQKNIIGYRYEEETDCFRPIELGETDYFRTFEGELEKEAEVNK